MKVQQKMFQTLWMMQRPPSWLTFVQLERQLQSGPSRDFRQLPYCQRGWIHLHKDRLLVYNPLTCYGLHTVKYFCNVVTYRDWCLRYLLGLLMLKKLPLPVLAVAAVAEYRTGVD